MGQEGSNSSDLFFIPIYGKSNTTNFRNWLVHNRRDIHKPRYLTCLKNANRYLPKSTILFELFTFHREKFKY